MILVAGATGTLGGMVARELLSRGESVRVLVRSGSDYAALVEAGAEPVEGDLKAPASLARACAGVKTVVTTANSVGRGGPDTIESVDRDGNRALIDAAAAAGVGHFVFVSALGASSDSAVDFLRAKAEAEAHLVASGISYTILQPDAFMEVWFGMIIGMALQQGRPITLVEPARSRHTFVSIRDVAAFITSAVARGPGTSETLMIGGPESLNWRAVVSLAEDVVGRALPVTYVAPGTMLPGLPDVVSHLAAGFETYETVFDMRDTAGRYGVTLTPAAECLSGMLKPSLIPIRSGRHLHWGRGGRLGRRAMSSRLGYHAWQIRVRGRMPRGGPARRGAMMRANRLTWMSGMALVAVAAVAAVNGTRLDAQSMTTNPYRPIVDWGELPEGRPWGATSAVAIAADGNIWVVERCGANTCVGSDVDPVLLFDKDGKLLRSFGAKMFAWPHGIHVDRDGNLWVADAWQQKATTTGHVVYKFSPEGKLLMTIGEPGQAGDPPNRLTRPSDVLTAPNGQIYIVEAHDQSKNRITKWAADGTYIETWGEGGYGPKQFRDPHALAMDSQGRIFVGDRYNNRIQIFDQDGNFQAIWTQFGRPSGIFIDADDRIYVADSESSPAPDKYMGQRNAGWEKGIRIGDAKTGWVHHFIPDDRINVMGYSGPEGIAVDDEGNLYGAEVTQRRVVKWVRFRP